MSNTALATADPVIVADELVDGKYDVQPTAAIRASHTNRKRFNAEALQQLAASIRTHGVIQPILIRPVTPTEDEPEAYEIVAGERRWRASVIAGMATIPVLIRRLSDLQAAEIQILENLQREDPHPLEEAVGYEQLMLKHGYNADQLADKIKRSRSYIYGRLKLCALTTSLREKFLDDEIPASIALLIARIPVPELQIRALDEIMNPRCFPFEPMPYRRAVTLIQQRFTLDLASATFPICADSLLHETGSCMKCPKRTGNQPEVFEDVKNENVCTDPDCFGEKTASHARRTITLAQRRGIPVYEGEEANLKRGEAQKKAGQVAAVYSFLHIFDRISPATGMSGRVSDHVKARAMPDPVAYIKNSNGTVDELYDRQDMQLALEAAGACENIEEHAKRTAGQPAASRVTPEMAHKAIAEKRAAAEKAATEQTKLRVALYSEMRRAGPGIEMVRAAAKLALNTFPLPDDLLGDQYSFNRSTEDTIRAYIDQASLPDALQIMIDMIFGELLGVTPWSDSESDADELETLTALASEIGIDIDQVRKSLIPEAPPELPSDAALDHANWVGLAAFITEHPERIDELTKAILTHPRGELTGMLERAAKTLGYTYSANHWHKGPPPSPAAEPEPDSDDGADLAGQVGDVTRTPAPTTGKSSGNKSKRRK